MNCCSMYIKNVLCLPQDSSSQYAHSEHPFYTFSTVCLDSSTHIYITMMHNTSIYCKIIVNLSYRKWRVSSIAAAALYVNRPQFFPLPAQFHLSSVNFKLVKTLRSMCACVSVFPFCTLIQPEVSCSNFFCPWSFQSPWKMFNVNVSTVYQWCNCLYTFRTPFLSSEAAEENICLQQHEAQITPHAATIPNRYVSTVH